MARMLTALIACVLGCGVSRADDAKQVLKDAVVVWHMNSPGALSPVGGGGAFGVRLEGAEHASSLAHGGDGQVVRLDGDALSAGQGAKGELNIVGGAISVLIRFKRTGGTWDVTPITKHGGHDKLQYNIYCFQRGDEFELGAEVGTTSGLGRTTAMILDEAAPTWHDVVLRYDGRSLDLFLDGTKRASSGVTGRLRGASDVPVIIGGEPQGGGIGRKFTGLVDHAAIWGRALSDQEIRALNAGVADEPPAPPDMRPLLRFTPERNWMNDPNGMIYLDGEYHLFYQYNPFGDQWGHMSWGHAVSKDALRWEHLGVAIPEENGVMAFSGTAVFDRENTSGLGSDGMAPLVAVYTGHEPSKRLQHQNLAFSLDRGRTWKKFAGNPVLDLGEAEFRDPKVFWHSPTARWVMVVALAAERKALFFTSTDLKAWTKASEFGPAGRDGVPNWECPDLFELQVDGDTNERRWVLVVNMGGNGPLGGSGCQYFVGSFDGRRFVNENAADVTLWVDHGKDFYAFQSFNDAPEGKRIGLAWMVNVEYAGATPTSPWRGSMTTPREFGLTRTSDGIRLTQRPLAGLESCLLEMGAKETVVDERVVSAGVTPTGIAGRCVLFEVDFEPGTASVVGVRVCDSGEEYTLVGYDRAKQEMFIDRTRSGRTGFHRAFAGRHGAPMAPDADGRVKLRVVVDVGSVEAFGSDGRVAISSLIFPRRGGEELSLFAEGGGAKLVRLRAVAMPSR